MLKLKLTTLDGLDASIAKEYKSDGSGGFILDTDTAFEDVSPLKNALAQEKAHRKTATEKVTELEEKVATLEVRAGSANDLEKAWQKKLEDKEKALQATIKQREGQLYEVLIDSEARKIATEVAIEGASDLLVPHLTSRLKLEEVDGRMVTRVLDSEGKMTALSVKEFQSEVVADKRFASILVASKASGGGAKGATPPAGGKAYKDMSESERTHLARTNRPEFDRQRGAFLASKQQQ